jgi:hypothetical protein
MNKQEVRRIVKKAEEVAKMMRPKEYIVVVDSQLRDNNGMPTYRTVDEVPEVEHGQLVIVRP